MKLEIRVLFFWLNSSRYCFINLQGTIEVTQDDALIETLNLKSNSIGPIGGEAIGKALSYNTTIAWFDISDNAIGEEGGMAFASTLQVCHF